MSEYLRAQSHPDKPNGNGNGNGLKGFFKSNLFAALVIFVLGQGIFVGGSIFAMYWKISTLTEWKGTVDKTLERMDVQGTYHGKSADDRQDIELARQDVRISKQEEKTEHIPVIESENRRLTSDVENLKNGKK